MQDNLQWFSIINNKPILRPHLQTSTFPGGGSWTTVFMPALEDHEYIEYSWNSSIKHMIKYFKNKY